MYCFSCGWNRMFIRSCSILLAGASLKRKYKVENPLEPEKAKHSLHADSVTLLASGGTGRGFQGCPINLCDSQKPCIDINVQYNFSILLLQK